MVQLAKFMKAHPLFPHKDFAKLQSWRRSIEINADKT
jgi:hypothetical protein